MFKVEFHMLGEGLWNRGAPPMTQLGAAYLARTLKELGFADEARVVPARPAGQAAAGEHALDIKV
ncbi:hypothetical protein [Phenylobacterium sp.]|uniref:hypothetical protein n=1 Tax=Phenylobacterium sp. TaxID=1871053 RepID=UPI0035B08D6A